MQQLTQLTPTPLGCTGLEITRVGLGARRSGHPSPRDLIINMVTRP